MAGLRFLKVGTALRILLKLVMTYVTSMQMWERRRIATAAHKLYQRRIAADYKPLEKIDGELARACVQDASLIIKAVNQ